MDHPALLTAYTRAEAVAAGFLVDVATRAQVAGFTIPVAMTPAAWSACIAWAPAAQVDLASPENLARLDQLLASCLQTIRRSVTCAVYQIESVTADAAVLFAAGDDDRTVSLKAVMDLADKAAGPALTIMLLDEY